MTDIEKKALALLNEVQMEMHGNPGWYEGCNRTNATPVEAVCRAIEQHEAFRQVVNCEMLEYRKWCKSVGLQFPLLLERFIIAKSDPLAEVVAECDGTLFSKQSDYVEALRAAIEARGGRIVWEGE